MRLLRALVLVSLGALACASSPVRARRTARPRRARHALRDPMAVATLRPLPGCPTRPGGGSFLREGQLHVEEVAFDFGHVCARMSDGTVRCTGENTNGELGPRTRGTTVREPTPIANLDRVAEVVVGRRLTCARRRDGTVRCLGSAEAGQLGTGSDTTPTPRGTFVPVQNLTDVAQLSTSLGTTCARLVDGAVRCWGRETEPVPVPLPGVSGVVELDLDGLFHGCARFDDATIRCGRFARAVPVSGATQLDAGASHACARIDDGSVRCWGFNSSGQLGSATAPGDTYTPVDPGVRCVTQVAAGGDHTCALVTDGTVRCWGGNHFGQLGDGTVADRAAPVAVSGATHVVRLSAGAGTTCAVDDEGLTQCWGQSLWLPGSLPAVLTRPTEVRW